MHKGLRVVNDQTIALCCNPPTNPCCPEVKITKQYFEISDDYGGKIKIEKEKVKQLLDQVNKLRPSV